MRVSGVSSVRIPSSTIVPLTQGRSVKQLLARNTTVYMAARSQSKAEQAIDELADETGHRARFIQLDLADISAVRAAAADFLSRENELHLLFANG